MIDYLGYILVRGLSVIFCVLPVGLGLFIGRALGAVTFIVNRKRRMVAYVNLKAAFSKEKTPAQIKGIVKRLYQNLGQDLIEVLRFPVINKRYMDRFISINGADELRQALSKQKGAIILTAHFGNWELSNLAGGFLLGHPVSVLAREQRHTRLNALLNSYRELSGCKVIKKGLMTRNLIKALRSNELVGMLGDQDAGRLGTLVNFFGRPASTHNGAFVFAEKTGAAILPAFLIRQNGPYHKLDILKPIDSAQEFSTLLEKYVYRFPEQWLWVHKRWKSTPYREIVILNDGKQGHLNQALAICDIIQKARQDRGWRSSDTVCKIIDIKYKNDLLRLLLGLCSNFSLSLCQGCMACVKFCLAEKSYKDLISTYADIVISAGSSLAPVNIFLKRELNAKNVVIMKPGLVNIKRFNLAILPRHDRPGPAKNVLVTLTAPNRITDELIQKEAQRFTSFLDLKRPRRLGLILGGDNPHYRMEPVLIGGIVSQIRAVCEREDLEVLATTSRRTPKDVELMLRDDLAGFPRCRLLVIANEKNMDGALAAILGLCQVVVVSGESISMVSEAASSGRFVLAFSLRKTSNRATRHERMIEELSKAGFIRYVDVACVGESIQEAFNSKTMPKRLNDYDRIYNAVGSLL